MKPLNPYAFPLVDTPYVERQDGMTLRDYFAGQALIALFSTPEWKVAPYHLHLDANIAYRLADAMLKEREK